MIDKIYLFIDTQALEALCFNLNHPAMQTVKSAISKGHAEILISSILEKEYLSHAGRLIEEAVRSISKSSPLDSFLSDELHNIREQIKKIEGHTFLDLYKAEFKPTNIDKDIDWRIVFSKYFANEAPFSKNKKNEFKDAFNIELLQDYTEKNLIIVSGDNDFFVWGQSVGLKCFRSLKDFSDYYLRMIHNHTQLLSVFQQEIKSFEKDLKKFVENSIDPDTFNVESYHAEVEDVDVSNFQILNHSILSVDTEANCLFVEFSCSIDCMIGLHCPVVVYDSVDKEDILLGSNKKNLEHTLNISVLCNVDIKDKEIDGFDIEDYDFKNIWLEIPHEWESFLDE